MKKKVIGLGIYTVVVLLIALIFHNHRLFDSIYSLITGILFVFILAQLMPGMYTSSGRPHEQLEYRNLETVPKRGMFTDMDLVSLLMTLYLVVPFLLALYFFG